jgi:hypothetical protein
VQRGLIATNVESFARLQSGSPAGLSLLGTQCPPMLARQRRHKTASHFCARFTPALIDVECLDGLTGADDDDAILFLFLEDPN